MTLLGNPTIFLATLPIFFTTFLIPLNIFLKNLPASNSSIVKTNSTDSSGASNFINFSLVLFN